MGSCALLTLRLIKTNSISPYKFEAPWHAFEFAFHVLEVESNLVIVSMAWMTREDRRHFSRMPNEPDMNTLTYWVTRLEPLIRSNNEDEIIVVFCNRTGTEDEATYAGTSAVIGIQEGEVKVYGLLGRGEKELLVVDTTNPPYAKMIYRPDVGVLSTPDGESEQPASADAQAPVGSGMSYTHLDDKANDGAEAPDQQGMHHESQMDAEQRRNHEFAPGPNQYPSIDRSTASTASLSPKNAQPSPTQTLGGHSQSTSSAKRRGHSISIPPPIEPVGHNQGLESSDIPTPSAPSPTPMAVRPRLIIPTSPSTLSNQQYTEDGLLSATSMKSVRSIQSIQSVKSDESEASVQTIRSNPRPPEDSTPYPHSGLPLSGYPANSFQSPFERRIYGGNVTISHETDGFSPTTPFDDSPISPRRFWRPHDSLFRTPVLGGGGGWTPSTPVGRKPEPFPWSAIKNAGPSTDKISEEEERSASGGSQGSKDAGSKSLQSPTSTTSSNKTGKSSSSSGANKTPQLNGNDKTGKSDSSGAIKTPQLNGWDGRTGRAGSFSGANKTPQPNGQNERHVSRPSSPKSRNASRSGIRGRTDSSLSQHNISTAVSQHIEQISQRAESRNRHEAKFRQIVPSVDDRLLSVNARPDSGADHLIPIIASPSLLGPGSRAYIPTPVAIDYYRHSTAQATPPNLSQPFESPKPGAFENSTSDVGRQQAYKEMQQVSPNLYLHQSESSPRTGAYNDNSIGDVSRRQQAYKDMQTSESSPRPGAFNNNGNIGRQQAYKDTQQMPTSSPAARSDKPKKSSRSVSRGRQPKRRGASANAAAGDPRAERATSADSIVNGILHTRIAKRHSADKDSQPSPHDKDAHAECVHPHSGAQDESQFERVEVISCPSCPIHGRQSASTNGSSSKRPSSKRSCSKRASSKRSSDPTGQRRHLARDAEDTNGLHYDLAAERKPNGALDQGDVSDRVAGAGIQLASPVTRGRGLNYDLAAERKETRTTHGSPDQGDVVSDRVTGTGIQLASPVTRGRASNRDGAFSNRDGFKDQGSNSDGAPSPKTVQTTISARSEPILSKSRFDPVTPRAMVFRPSDTSIETLPDGLRRKASLVHRRKESAPY